MQGEGGVLRVEPAAGGRGIGGFAAVNESFLLLEAETDFRPALAEPRGSAGSLEG